MQLLVARGAVYASCCSFGYYMKGSNCALVLDSAQLPYLEAYNTMFVL